MTVQLQPDSEAATGTKPAPCTHTNTQADRRREDTCRSSPNFTPSLPLSCLSVCLSVCLCHSHHRHTYERQQTGILTKSHIISLFQCVFVCVWTVHPPTYTKHMNDTHIDVRIHVSVSRPPSLQNTRHPSTRCHRTRTTKKHSHGLSHPAPQHGN